MARFDVYLNTGNHAQAIPYLLDVQSDLLDALDSRMVIPLRRLESFPAIKLPSNLTPIMEIDGRRYILETPKMAAIPARQLKSSLASLQHEQARITAALDFLFHGF